MGIGGIVGGECGVKEEGLKMVDMEVCCLLMGMSKLRLRFLLFRRERGCMKV